MTGYNLLMIYKRKAGFLFHVLLFLGLALESLAQETYTITGYVEDVSSGEKLIGANVYDVNTYDGTVTNTFGFFSITLPVGEVTIAISYIGFATQQLELDLQSDMVVDIELDESVKLAEVEIVAEKQRNIAEESQMSTIEVPILQIKKIPALLGEVDVLKALQLLPGVQSGGEGQSGLYVRGGSPDQNLVLLDGVPVYNVSHLFGFFSVFNADAIKDVKLIKGGFPSRYGGRLSSVIDITMKDGNKKEFNGAGSIGLISSKLTLEGPIVKDKTSFIISGRRTYVDQLLRPFIQRQFREDNNEGGTGYFFYDVNAKINHTFSSKDRLYLSFYGGRDKFFFNSREIDDQERDFAENELGWGNVTAALRWNHLWTPKLFSNATLTYSTYDLNTFVGFGTEFVEEEVEEITSLGYDLGIEDVTAKIDFDFLPNPNQFIRFGLSVINHNFNPGIFELVDNDPFASQNLNVTFGQDVIIAQEYDAYIEDDIKVNDKLKINAGLHFSAFDPGEKFYTSVQPRVSMRYLLADNSSIKASFASMRQYVNLLTNEGIGLPTDLWVPATDRILPQESWQAALGYAFKLTEDLDITIEGYYKSFSNLISFKDGNGVFELTDWQDRITQGDGRSYGAEFFVQKKEGRFSGWVGYTLSWSDRQFEEINFGERFPFRFDRRHDVSVVLQYDLTERIDISGSWVYGTGQAQTLGNSTYIVPFPRNNSVSFQGVEFIDQRNGFRLRPFHRMDFGINFKKNTNSGKRVWSIGAYNAYNRKNPFFVQVTSDIDIDLNTGERTNTKTLSQISLFPIIPYVTFSFEF